MPRRVALPRHRASTVAAVAVLLATLSPVASRPAFGQRGQNPSPMSDTTRPHPRLPEARPAGQRAKLSIGELFLSDTAMRQRRDALPLVIHFHGAAWLAEQHVATAAPHAALISVNLGSGSSRYAAPFADARVFPRWLDEAADAVASLGRPRPTWSSVTLTAWSAGYGAVRALLREPDATARVSAIVLLDGLHASYVVEGDPGAPRATDPSVQTEDLAVFLRLATDAANGRLTFVVTHSEVYPGTFASTTESADVLLRTLGLRRRPVLKAGPLGMQQLSEASRGRFHVLGFAGNSAPDHVDHLYALGDWLRRWKLAR